MLELGETLQSAGRLGLNQGQLDHAVQPLVLC